MLWLVRWSGDGTAAIVSAADERDLAVILDEQGDPFGATFEPYEGPIWFEFQSIAEHNTPEELCNPEADLKRPIRVPDTDTGGEMKRTVMELTHSAYSAAVDKAFEEGRPLTPEELAAALTEDESAELEEVFDSDVFEGHPLESAYANRREVSDPMAALRVEAVLRGAPDLEVVEGGLQDEDDGLK